MKKGFKKLGNIIVGWFRRLFNIDSELSKKRVEICRSCPKKVTILGDDFCSLCYCQIVAKSRVEDETCYDGKWDNIKINENE